MTKEEALKFVRKIVYKMDIYTAQKELYALVNGKPMPKDKEEVFIKIKKQQAFGVSVDSNIRDSKGNPIYFPKVGSHYDRALQKTFHSKREKQAYMKDNNLHMDGSSEKSTKPIEAGDYRFKFE